jgi:hypothetical protein
MAVRLSALHAGRHLLPGIFLVLISVRGKIIQILFWTNKYVGCPRKNSGVLVIHIYSLLNYRVGTLRKFSAESVQDVMAWITEGWQHRTEPSRDCMKAGVIQSWPQRTELQLNVNFGQHRTAVTSQSHCCCHLYLVVVTRYKMAASPECTICKKVRYHNTLCVLVRHLLPLGTRSSQ